MTSMLPTRSGRAIWTLLSIVVLVYLAQGVFYARTLITWDDESSHLALGYLAVIGEISLYQDDMTGHRMPLPLYVLGASQLVFGPSLWAARLLSLALGLCALGLTIVLARRLGGNRAGLLAGLFLATQGTIVSYYGTAMYHSLTALILLAAVWAFLKEDLPWRYALGMAIASLIFLTRTNLFPAVMFFFVWGLLGAKSAVERVTVILVTAAPPAIFFLSDPTHLKLLAYVPFLSRLVESLGYRSLLEFRGVPQDNFEQQLWGLVHFGRRYESWTLALAGLTVAGMLLWFRKRPRLVLNWNREVTVVVALWGWIFLWQLVIFRLHFKWISGYFPSFAPLSAVLLGIGFASLLARLDLPRLARAVLVTALATTLTISVIFPRNPLLPRPVQTPFDQDAIQLINRAAADLRVLLPHGARVFLFAQPMPAYLAGLKPYLQQLQSPGATLAPIDSDERLVAKSGLWGHGEIERWLGREAGYAIISPQVVEAFVELRPENVKRIRELLQERFELVGSVGGATYLATDVYRRVDARSEKIARARALSRDQVVWPVHPIVRRPGTTGLTPPLAAVEIGSSSTIK